MVRTLDLRSTGREFEYSLSAIECNPGQVVNTRASVTKQYNLVLYQPVGGDALWLGR